MGRRLDAVLGWMDRLDQVTLGRWGLLPQQVVQRRKAPAHPVLLALGSFLLVGGLSFALRRAWIDESVGTSIVQSSLYGLIPVFSITIQQFVRRRSSSGPPGSAS